MRHTMPDTILENSRLRLAFSAAGTLNAVDNRLTGETYQLTGDEFAIETTDARRDFADFALAACEVLPGEIQLRYQCDLFAVDIRYTLGQEQHFVEKRMTITLTRDCGVCRVVLSESEFSAEGLELACYRQPNYDRIEAHDQQYGYGNKRRPGSEPVRTFFGRTALGGFFTGVEMPFDASTLDGGRVVLAFSPNLKLRAGEALDCEPLYLGVYRRQALDARAMEMHPADQPAPGLLPLPSESAAMVAMTSTILGPPRHGLVAMPCGWHCQMEQFTYTPKSAAADMRSLDFLAECGVEWFCDSHPWGGETEKMNALSGDDRYEPGPLERQFLEHAQELGLGVMQWPTMNHTHPWSPAGQPFRQDRPDWRRVLAPLADDDPEIFFRGQPANCFAHTPFYAWIEEIMLQALATGYYRAWVMDGDFWGTGAYFITTVPVECLAEAHDHLPGDANFACQRNLDRLIARVRRAHPDIFIGMCRPPMDLGVWSQRNVDACFTLIESGSGSSNIAGGDEIRTVSRIRVQHHFFPHTLDWPLLFPSYCNPEQLPAWPSAKLDYILLSALSCSPNLCMYLPTKLGIPEEDKAEIRRWLAWGKEHLAYLQVRQDLPDWPAAGKVDGSAHLLGDHGLIFLFNPNADAHAGEFHLSAESIGLHGEGTFSISQAYPASEQHITARAGEAVRWEVPGESAVVLWVRAE